ncbi:unnamed protein product [Dibothriocephalus latus]|uniref:PH-like domain-containing protein n=1 Tax=Dibothriocephalus latus TaxID=60516 RepID=A0A3P6SMY0_DIBLA|nr:unnamed protein product [Dibothriocephalus latus]
MLFQDKHTNKYRPFKINEKPFVIIWSKHFGLFRTSARHPLNFLLIMEQPDYAMHEFNCTTNDEVVRWQKVFTDGFAKCGRGKCVSKEKLCKLIFLLLASLLSALRHISVGLST